MNLTKKQKETLLLWLINERQLTPDQAEDQIENFPNQSYFEFLKGRITNQSKPFDANTDRC